MASKVGQDGKTSLERYRGSQSHQAVVAFGEQVLYKPSRTVQTFKDEMRWEPGTWLGIMTESREHIIGTSRGVFQCRAIAAVQEEKKFIESALHEMQGVPWQPVPGRKNNKIPTRIAEEGEEEVEDDEAEKFEVQVEELEEDKDMPRKPHMTDMTRGSRAMYVKQQDIRDHGPTKGCMGCRAIKGKWSYIPSHSHACRTRIAQAIMQNELGRRRVAEAEERLSRAQSHERLTEFSQRQNVEVHESRRPAASSTSAKNKKNGDGHVEAEAAQPPADDNDFEWDIGEDIDPEKWKAFCEKHGIKRSCDGEQDGGATKKATTEQPTKSGEKRASEIEKDDEGRSKSIRLNLMERQLDKQMKELLAMDVAEIFSPKRVNEFANACKLQEGWSFDLTTTDEEGAPWNFNDPNMRNKAARRVLQDKPMLLIGSPPCTYFSQLMRFNWSRMDPDEAWQRWNSSKHR